MKSQEKLYYRGTTARSFENLAKMKLHTLNAASEFGTGGMKYETKGPFFTASEKDAKYYATLASGKKPELLPFVLKFKFTEENFQLTLGRVFTAIPTEVNGVMSAREMINNPVTDFSQLGDVQIAIALREFSDEELGTFVSVGHKIGVPRFRYTPYQQILDNSSLLTVA